MKKITFFELFLVGLALFAVCATIFGQARPPIVPAQPGPPRYVDCYLLPPATIICTPVTPHQTIVVTRKPKP
jgi:hypothetical protein